MNNIPTIKELIEDPSTPTFVANFIKQLRKIDIVDAANYTEVIAKVMAKACDEICKQHNWASKNYKG